MQAYILEGVRLGGVIEVPMPAIKDDEVLIKVMAAGWCGTDGHIYNGDYYSTFPLIPGHEFAGVVAGMGRSVTRFREGQRVAADPNIFCEKCHYCQQNMQNFCQDFAAAGVTRDGAFAEYIAVAQGCVFAIGDMNYTTAAMIEPLACVVYGQQRARPELGQDVLILGAGPIGLLHLQVARHNGAAAVTVADLRPERLALAKELGAAHTVLNDDRSGADLKIRAPMGFSLVIDTTGVPGVVASAVPLVKNGGMLLIFGVCPQDAEVGFSPYEIYKRDLRIIGSFALKKTFQPAIELLRHGLVDVGRLISDRLTLAELSARAGDLAQGKIGMKAVIYPNGEPIQDNVVE